MAATRPPATPEGVFIRRLREAHNPPLSIPKAAALAGMSAENWGHIERGYQASRPVVPPAPTLARMADALGTTPERLETEVGRADAAELLREMQRDKAAPQQPPGARKPPDPVTGFVRPRYLDPEAEEIAQYVEQRWPLLLHEDVVKVVEERLRTLQHAAQLERLRELERGAGRRDGTS